jgi:hypothetical protein
LRDKINFKELRMVFESWRDRLRWIIEHDGEYFPQWHLGNSAISWTSKTRRMFLLLFGHSVYDLVNSASSGGGTCDWVRKASILAERACWIDMGWIASRKAKSNACSM